MGSDLNAEKRHFWTLGRKLGLTAWIYVASILVNLGVSSACLLLYFKPELQQAEAFYVQQQQVERIRAEVRKIRTPVEHAQTGQQQAPDSTTRRLAISKAVLQLDGTPVAKSLGPLWEQIIGAVRGTNRAAEADTASRVSPSQPSDILPDQSLNSLDRLLSEAIKTLGTRRQASILAASEAQWWIIRILILSSCVAATLCVIGLWFVRKWVVQPVGVLKQAATQLREGNFDLQVNLPFEDEMGKLGNEITQMAAQISHLQQQLLDRERQSAASELIAHLEEYMREPLSEIQALAAANSGRHAGNKEIAECQERIADTVSRFENWLHDLNTALAPAKSDLRPTEISTIISDVLSAVRPTLDRLQVQIKVNLDPRMKDAAVDRLQLEQALIVLVTNAAEASTAGQAVRIQVQPATDTTDYWELQVEDDGSGIPPELIERVFLPFFTTKRDGNGLGLGLAKAIIHQHGGELRVESEPGKGSRFTVRLPTYPPNSGPGQIPANILDDRPESAGPAR